MCIRSATLIKWLKYTLAFPFIQSMALAKPAVSVITSKGANKKKIQTICVPKVGDGVSSGRCIANSHKCPFGFIKIKTSELVGPNDQCNTIEATEL